VTLRGVPKPSLAAFELPLAQTARSGSTTSLWGELRAPAAGTEATLQRKLGAAWRTVASFSAGRGGFFRWHGTLPKGATVRLHAGALNGAPLVVS
jgi:hypothetical protein